MESARQKDPHFILSLAGRGESGGEISVEMISLG
jgi:hypothetical protein